MAPPEQSGGVAISIRSFVFVGASASAGLLVLSQPPYEWGFVAAFALVPWLWRVRRAGAPGAFGMGLLFGVLFAIGAGSWIFDALAAEGSWGLRALAAAVLIAVWAKGLLFAAAGWFVNRLQAQDPVIAIGVPSLLFGLGEYWMSHSAWGLPLLLLGHSQISVPGVAQLAFAIGVPGISAMLFALNLSLVSVLFGGSRAWRFLIAIGAIWLVAGAIGVPLARALSPQPRGQPRRLLVVQPASASHGRWESAYQEGLLEAVAEETDRALTRSRMPPDVILWPESLLSLSIAPGARLRRRLQRQIDEWGIPVVLGLLREAEGVDDEKRAAVTRPDRYLNSVIWWSPIRGPIASQDKKRAIPVVESSRRFLGQGILDWLIARGADGPRVVEAERARPMKGEFTLTPALCFEILFPQLVADRRDEQALAIVNLADDSWVAGEVLDAQLIAAGAFRAIEQRLPMVRVSHGGLSVAIDRFGRTIASLPPDRAGHMTVELASTARPPRLESELRRAPNSAAERRTPVWGRGVDELGNAAAIDGASQPGQIRKRKDSLSE